MKTAKKMKTKTKVTAPHINHTHSPYKATEDGRFILYKHDHTGSYGWQGKMEYILLDTKDGKQVQFENQKRARCAVLNIHHGLELAPYFGSNAKDGDISSFKNMFTAIAD
jgi:hypothetical protein